MKITHIVKEAYERGERVNAIKAMKKNNRSEEQQQELKRWKYEEKRNTVILLAGMIAWVKCKNKN